MITEYSDDHGSNTSAPEDLRLDILQPFLQCCMTVVPDARLTRRARAGVFLFMLGAADRLWARLGLDDSRFPSFAANLLQQRGLAADEALTLAYALPSIREDASAGECLLEGADALDLWLDSHDPDSVLRLGDLIAGWQSL